MKTIRGKLLITLCIAFQSCEMLDFVEYHPYDGHISGATGVNAANIARIEKSCRGKTVVRFAFMGDTQRHYDETEDFVNAVNARNDIDFVIHGGDIADFGLTREFEWMRDIMNELTVPYVVIIGNHDCLANGSEVFCKIFGDENFTFTAGATKFVCLNTNAIEYNYSHPVPDFSFIENQIDTNSSEYSKTVVAMHAPPFCEQFNNNIAKEFQNLIRNFPSLQFCLNAHEHNLTTKDHFDDGIIYYGTPSIDKRQYILFTLTPNGYDYEITEF
ncbi:MAG: metallophosphoesterase [Bacteroidales bacterium]|jgi:predicted phosphodiesterase|nr:metallophosphoesterase [Bacteroidales bacterium]